MPIPTEPVGSVPRPAALQQAMQAFANGEIAQDAMDAAFDAAVQETIERFEQTGSPIISDGEQTKSSFVTYPLDGLTNLRADGVMIAFEDGHTRQLPCLTAGPFRYGQMAGNYLPRARRFASKPVKQAVISASAMSLLYPADGLDNYSREQFIDDLVEQATADIRSCFDHGAQVVQVDFTEGRLAVKLDPSKALLRQFVELNNRVFANFTEAERERIGVHTCPGGDHNSTHSADVDYGELIPLMLEMNVGRFYMQMASESDPARVLQIVGKHLKPSQRVFIGVIDVINNEIETPEVVRDRVLEAARFIAPTQLGTTDDCGFSPFGDDIVQARNIAFAKIKARVEGTALAAQVLGL